MDLQRISELGFEKISVWCLFVLVLAFSFHWNFLVFLQCFLVFVISTSQFAYDLDTTHLRALIYVCDVVYLVEVVFTLCYCWNKRLRKLKYAKIRHWVFIVVDFISLVPLDVMYMFHYVNDEKDPVVGGILAQNRSLRIYRVFFLEWFYMDTIRTPWKHIAFVFILFLGKLFVVGHILSCIWYNLEHAVPCDKKKYNCYVWHEVNILNVLLLNWTGPVNMFSTTSEQLLVTFAMLAGFLLIYTYIYPYTFYFSILTGCKDSVFVEKRKRLSKYLKNKIKHGQLKSKIVHYFNYLWSEGEEDSELESLLMNIPLALQKEIMTDIYWEAFRHSDLLRAGSRSFKRSLSLLMKTQYHHDGEVVYYKGQKKGEMLYLVQGILQVMAEENQNSPLLSFSSGTVFGELSLFLLTRSQAIVKCKGYCELQILSNRNILTVMMDYPKDRKQVFERLSQRLLLARYTQWRKKTFKEDQKLEMLSKEPSYFTVMDCVRWLKMQWRNSWAGHKRHKDVLKAKAEGTRLSSWRVPVRPDIKIEFISNYLDLVVLSNILEEKKGNVCLETKFPWAIDPSTQFLRIWKVLILVTSVIPLLAYPVSTSWCDTFPTSIYLLSYVVTLIFQIDVFLKLITAVETKHATITSFCDIFLNNLRNVYFYLDVFAAFPYQALITCYWGGTAVEAYKVGLFLHPAILKSYVFIRLGAPLGNYVDIVTMCKNCAIYFLLLYGLAEVIQLQSVRNIFGRDNEWIDRYLENQEDKEFLRKYLVSVFKSFITAISVPSTEIYADGNVDLVLTCLVRYLFFVFTCFFMGSYYSSIVVKRFGAETFRILLDRLKSFLASKKVSDKIILRIVKCIKFQWDYDNADFISSEVSILNSMPYNIRRQVYFETTYNTLQSNAMFQEETEEFLLEVLECSDCVAVPPGLVLVTYGHTSHLVIIIHRGFCQLNSHLIKDITSNLGRPIILGPSAAFPLLSSFCNVPSPISVVTITDCELIVIDLNKLISIMIKHDVFKDIVDLVREQDLPIKLLASRPALMKICAFEVSGEDSELDIRELGCLKKCWYSLIKKCRIFATTTFLKYWGYFYMVYLIVDCALWPCSFGVLVYHFHVIVPTLQALKLLIVVHMIIHSFLPFFNADGLMVTHPVHTFTNYMSSTFVLDFIRLLPIFTVYYYGFCDPFEQPNIYVIIVTSLQSFLGLIYVTGCIGYIGSIFNDSYYSAICKIILSLTLLFNLHVNICMLTFCTWSFDSPHVVSSFSVKKKYSPNMENILREGSATDYYLYICYWVLNTLTTNDYGLHVPTDAQLYLSYCHGFVGTIMSYYIYVSVSSASKFANMGGAIFREEFVSLIKYLEYEKTEDRTIERIRSYYKYIWSKSGGENIKEIFGRLPLYLLEELWYPMYRPTFVKNSVFEDADEGFFRILSTHVSSVFFNRGSLIIFRNESQSYIYFLHKGKCFVYDWFMILDMGSIVGDVHQNGLMLNKVYALTHVEMLKISSRLFFSIVNNFDTLEANFFYVLKKTENFIKSDVYREYRPLRPVDSRDAVNAFDLRKKEIGFEDESHFEDPENILETFQSYKYKPKEKRTCIIYPYNWKMWLYTYLSFANVILTAFIVPFFAMFGSLSLTAFITVAILDFIWLLLVITTFFVGLTDHEKGDVITNHKYIAKNYLKNAFGFDVLSLVPFELIPLAVAKSRVNANSKAVAYLRVFRYLRAYSYYKFRELDFWLVKSESSRECFYNIIFFFWTLIFLASVFVEISDEPIIKAAKNPLDLSVDQLRATLYAILYVINFVTSANIPTFIPSNKSELLHFNISVILLLYVKGRLMSKILSFIYFKSLSIFNYKTQAAKLESYLSRKEASPILIKGVVNYQTNLFRFSRSENMPSLLNRIPSTVRIPLMKDLFIKHVNTFPLFEGLDHTFLDQLISRAKREVYFPGEKIVEQGDVDHRLYFIHTGEVYVINQTKERAYIEYVVGRMYAGDFFGEAQGLWFIKPHVYTFRGRTLVEIIALHSDDWMDLRKTFPDVTLKIFQKAKALRYI